MPPPALLLLTGANAAFFRHRHACRDSARCEVVSPADGLVCLIQDANCRPPSWACPDTPLPRVSIFLSVLDAHVREARRSATVVADTAPAAVSSAELEAASGDNGSNSVVVTF